MALIPRATSLCALATFSASQAQLGGGELHVIKGESRVPEMSPSVAVGDAASAASAASCTSTSDGTTDMLLRFPALSLTKEWGTPRNSNVGISQILFVSLRVLDLTTAGLALPLPYPSASVLFAVA